MDQPNAKLIQVSYPDNLDEHTYRRARAVADAIMDALQDADLAGLVVEVTLHPGTPLAQGNYYPHIQMRQRKDLGMAREEMLKTWSAIGAAEREKTEADGVQRIILAHGVPG